jgi:BASS family bile acid:Na+ symporter
VTLAPIARPLAFIGRYGTQGFAISIFLGLALPQFAAAARPLLAITIFVFVMTTFMRADLSAVRRLLARPGPLLIAIGWLVLAPALLIWMIVAGIGRENLDSGLVLGLAIIAAAPPIMSGPAVALLLGLEPTLILSSVLLVTLLSPLFSPQIIEIVAGGATPLNQLVLLQRLLVFIIGAAVAGIGLARLLGRARLERNKASLDGIGVVMYFVFAIAAMDGVLAAAVATPGLVAGFLAVVFAISFSGLALAWFILRPLVPADRFILGYVTCQRNMGLLIAAFGAATPPTTFLFFALAQFPIYLMPQIIKPLARRFAVSNPPAEIASPPSPA